MSDIVTKEEMKAEEQVILKVFRIFEKDFKEMLSKGSFSINQFNDIANKSMEQIEMTEKQKNVVDGFLTTYLGLFTQYGNVAHTKKVILEYYNFDTMGI